MAAIACPHRSFPHLPRLKRPPIYPPCGCGYPFGSMPSDVATVCLALRPDGVSSVHPRCTESPFACGGCYPSQEDVQHPLREPYPSFIAPTGSCAPPSSSRGFRIAYTARLCRLRRAPAGRCWFPTLSLRVCPSMLGPLPRRRVGCIYPLLPQPHRPSPSPYEVGSPQQSAQRLPSGGDFGAAVIHSCSGLEVCCHPGRSHRRVYTRGSRGVYVRAEHRSLPSCASDMLAVRTGN